MDSKTCSVEEIASYIENDSECLMPIVVEETRHAYGVRLLKTLAAELREKFGTKQENQCSSN